MAPVLLILCLAAGCGGGGGDELTIDPSAAIEGFDAAPEAGSRPRARLNAAVLAEPDASREVALAGLESESPDVRIAAAYALSITLQPEDADALAPLLESASSGERVLEGTASSSALTLRHTDGTTAGYFPHGFFTPGGALDPVPIPITAPGVAEGSVTRHMPNDYTITLTFDLRCVTCEEAVG